MHPLITSNSNYEPSSSSKNRWLYTRKYKISFQNLTLPGLFQTYNYPVDSYMFALVLGLEAYGIYVLWAILPTPIFAFVGLAMDVVCAVFAHLMHKHICLAKNKKLLAENGYLITEGKTKEYEINKQKNIIIKNSVYEFIFYGLIIILAALKVLTILSFASASDIVPGMKILIAMIYLITAYIHIFHTGYFVFENWFKFFAKIEKKKVDDHTPEVFIEKQINDGILLERTDILSKEFKPGKVNKHSLINMNGITHFKSWGILQDSELNDLVKLQEGNDQRQLAIELLACQINMLQSGAYRASVTR
jgi:hypothetical protein